MNFKFAKLQKKNEYKKEKKGEGTVFTTRGG